MPADTDSRSTLVLPPFDRRGLRKAGVGITLVGLPVLAGARPAAAATQAGWRYCTKCRGLVYANLKERAGDYPAGGKHRGFPDNFRYFLHYDIPPDSNRERDNFKCRDCAGLFRADSVGPSRCPAGGRHRRANIDYLVWTGPTQPGQEPGWHWCDRCWSLFWPGTQDPAGVCPRGGKHRAVTPNREISVDYTSS